VLILEVAGAAAVWVGIQKVRRVMCRGLTWAHMVIIGVAAVCRQ